MDLFKQFAKGEPVVVGQIVFLLLAAIGLNVNEDMAGQLGILVLGAVVTWLQRRNATPAANPAVPTLVVKDGKVGAVPPPQPVITFAGRRA